MTGRVLFAAVVVGAMLSSSSIASAAEDHDLESAIMQMPAPASGFVACEATAPSGRLDLADIGRETGLSFGTDARDAVADVELVIYRREWCRDDGAVVEVRGLSSEQPRTGSSFMSLARRSGGDEFSVPITDAFGSSRAVAGGDAHLVAFARNNRFFAVTLWYVDDPSAPSLTIEIAEQLEARADSLDTRGGPPPWWQMVLGIAVIVGVVASIGWLLRLLMRRNRAADARARGGIVVDESSAAPSRDPLGFG